MSKTKFYIVFLVVCSAGFSHAGEFDGSKPFICAIIDAHECVSNNNCSQVSVQSIDCPRFLKVDVQKKTITGTVEDQSVREVDIKFVNHVDENLILQGIQKGRAWSMVISETTGKMTLSISGKDEGFIFFGECIVQ